MSTTDILFERSEILSSFNEDEIAHLLDEQITNEFEDLASLPVDYFKPLYYRYRTMREIEMDDDLRNEFESKFRRISKLFIDRICRVFNISVDSRYMDDHINDIPCLALALYSFFVLEVMQNIEDVLHNFIVKNHKMLYDLFEDQKNKKDGSTIIYQKKLSPKMALLIANIYIVSSYSIDNMTEDDYFDCLPEGYVPGIIIKDLYQKGHITGSFMETIKDMYNQCNYLRSIICFNIESGYRNTTPNENVSEEETKVEEKTSEEE